MSLFFPTKDERKNQHKLILSVLIPLIVLFYLFTPTYPEINNSLGFAETKKSARHNIAMYTLLLHPQTIEEKKEYRNIWNNLVNRIDNCSNVECIISEYEECMEDYGSSFTRKMARSKFMIDKFGIVGEGLNKSFRFMY